LVKTPLDRVVVVEIKTNGDTLAEVQPEAPLDTIAHRLAQVEIETPVDTLTKLEAETLVNTLADRLRDGGRRLW